MTKPVQKTIVYGSFKGMGDLLSAAPVILRELNASRRVVLLCFPGRGLEEFASLIDFGSRRGSLELLSLPVDGGWQSYRRFFHGAAAFKPDLVWVSPHAPAAASSWKVPLAMWVTKQLYWGGAEIAGAASERLAFLFDRKAPVDRNLPMKAREWTAFALACELDQREKLLPINFVQSITKALEEPSHYDLLIHPGATAQNRSWPFAHYAEVVRMMPKECRIAVLGLPRDIDVMKRELPVDRGLVYLTGNLEQAIATIARSRVVLTMDSGNVHFASVLGIPAVALFGKSDPATVISRGECVFPIYEQKFSCQPCQAATCSQPEVFCMNSLSPVKVAASLLRLLHTPEKSLLPVHLLTNQLVSH